MSPFAAFLPQRPSKQVSMPLVAQQIPQICGCNIGSINLCSRHLLALGQDNATMVVLLIYAYYLAVDMYVLWGRRA